MSSPCGVPAYCPGGLRDGLRLVARWAQGLEVVVTVRAALAGGNDVVDFVADVSASLTGV